MFVFQEVSRPELSVHYLSSPSEQRIWTNRTFLYSTLLRYYATSYGSD